MPSPIITDKEMLTIWDTRDLDAIPPIITARQFITPSVPPYTADFKYSPLAICLY